MRLISNYQFIKFELLTRYICAYFALTIPAGAWALNAIEYDARLCSAGIVVLAADLPKLSQPTTPENQKLWLQQRINGAQSSLGWLCRRYAVLHGLDELEIRNSIQLLRTSLAAKDWSGAKQQLSEISNLSPLQTENLKPGSASEPERIEGGKIYSRYCKSCHVRSMPAVTPPIFSLSEMAQTLPEKEFIARMIVGVHGTPTISLQNPLSDRDISGMFLYLLGTP